jgi:LAS superfamily LD-carboxypeptidase LdcB
VKVTGYRKGQPFALELAEIAPGQWLSVPAAADFILMAAAALEDGITLIVNTSFREWEHQLRLYTDYCIAIEKWKKNGSDPKRKPAPVAQPGYSNHQAGTAADLNRAHDDNEDGEADGEGPTDRWLAKNAHRFNFRRTVKREKWHWEHLKKAA